jgi:spore coat polysaccharide biosynthesis predicted glycosyltransferase SpsG
MGYAHLNICVKILTLAPEIQPVSKAIGALLVCQASAEIGLGHLSRILVVARALLTECGVCPHILIIGEHVERNELSQLSHSFHTGTDDFSTVILRQANEHVSRVVLFDLHPKLIPASMAALLRTLRAQNVRTVGIDSLLALCVELDLMWVPTFSLPAGKVPLQCSNVRYGWDTFLLRKTLPSGHWLPGSRVLVLTGGGDTTHQGDWLPALMDSELSAGIEVHWVRGPFAVQPRLPVAPRLKWIVHPAPQGLDELMVHCNYAVAIFGISFFELLQYGIPTVVFSPYGGKDDFELGALRSEQVASVAADATDAVRQLASLMQDDVMARSYATRSAQLLSVNGAQALAARIFELSRS